MNRERKKTRNKKGEKERELEVLGFVFF